jgi:hypothetical protein
MYADHHNPYLSYCQAKQREALAARQPKLPVEPFPPVISVIVNPPSPVMSDDGDEILPTFSDDSMSKCEQHVFMQSNNFKALKLWPYKDNCLLGCCCM